MADNLDEEKKSADGYSSVPDPANTAPAKQSSTGADLKKKVDPNPDEVEDGVTKKTKKPEVAVEGYDKKDKSDKDDDDDDENEIEESVDISSLFEGIDVTETFKDKATLIFEAAVNEAAAKKAAKITESIEEDLQEQFNETLEESIEEIVENLDGYLDYVVSEWMEENEIALESGIKVEMAESFMEGLKELFYEHNIELDEEAIDVVAELEEELEEAKTAANKAINDYIALEEQVERFAANEKFNELTEDLSQAQKERLRILSEKLDVSDLDTYATDLVTLKKSFFKEDAPVTSEDLNAEGNVVVLDEEVKAKASNYESVNNYAEFMKTLK